MSQNLTVNGTIYAFPVTLETNWGTVVTNWASAVSQHTLQKSGGTFTLTADAYFGATYGLQSQYFKSATSLISTAGVIRLANTDSIGFRNAADSANLLFGVNASNQLTFNSVVISGSSALTASRAVVTDGSGVQTVATTTATEIGYVNGVTSAIQTQIDAKAPIASPTFTGTVSGVTASMVGLGNVDNTSDANKPISTATQTALNLKAPIASPTFTGTVGGITASMVGLGNVDNTSDATKNSASVTLTNKTLTAPVLTTPVIDVISATDQGSTPASPSAGTTKVYSKTDGKVYKLTSAGVEQELGAGAGGGSINYLAANPDAETGTTGYATYKDAAAALPVDGTGGSPTLTFTRTTSGPLRGTGSFLITTTAANLQGEGASYDFTLSTADQAKVMSISFDYNIASGTYVTGDMAVYIYDVTNALVIQPAGFQIQAVGSTLPNKHIATFQTSSNSTSYRLIFHRAVSTSSAMTMKIDNVQVGPQVVQYGAPVTDWVSYTPTGSWTGGNVTYTGQWRRVGSDMEISANIALTGAPTGGSLTSILIPTGYTIDTSKIAGYGANEIYVGVGTIKAATVGSYPCFTTVSSTTAIRPLASSAAGTYLGADTGVTATVPGTFTSGDYIKLSARIPITGWSSTVQMSNDTDTRVVECSVSRITSDITITAASTNEVVVFNNIRADTHGAYSTSTGLYTVQVPGFYEVAYQVRITMGGTAAAVVYTAILKNGTTPLYGNWYGDDFVNSKTYTAVGKAIIQCNAGDTLSVVCDSTGQNVTLPFNATNDNVSMHIKRISGPSAIAASETVKLKYRTSATTAFSGAGAANTFIANTRVYDSHGAYNTSTGVITIPVVGSYCFKVHIAVSNASASTVSLTYKKNGSSVDRDIQMKPIETTFSQTHIMVTFEDTLNAGDTVDFNYQYWGGSASLTGDSSQNWVTMMKVGN